MCNTLEIHTRLVGMKLLLGSFRTMDNPACKTVSDLGSSWE